MFENKYDTALSVVLYFLCERCPSYLQQRDCKWCRIEVLMSWHIFWKVLSLQDFHWQDSCVHTEGRTHVRTHARTHIPKLPTYTCMQTCTPVSWTRCWEWLCTNYGQKLMERQRDRLNQVLIHRRLPALTASPRKSFWEANLNVTKYFLSQSTS